MFSLVARCVVRRRLVSVAVHPGNISFSTAATAFSRTDDLTYVQLTCLACAQARLVNPKTGKVLGAEDE
jgi:hypothetical protein